MVYGWWQAAVKHENSPAVFSQAVYSFIPSAAKSASILASCILSAQFFFAQDAAFQQLNPTRQRRVVCLKVVILSRQAVTLRWR
jgi:hypothetical protein